MLMKHYVLDFKKAKTPRRCFLSLFTVLRLLVIGLAGCVALRVARMRFKAVFWGRAYKHALESFSCLKRL